MLVHPIEPLYDKNSKVLILGSFPSVKSREANFFYGHPQNRFWKVMGILFDCPNLSTVEKKKELVLNNHLALWDVIHSCEIVGSSDASIRDVVANDLTVILNEAKIEMIYCNGTKSYELYNKYIKDQIHREAIKLPSTSPANARIRLEELIQQWAVIKLTK